MNLKAQEMNDEGCYKLIGAIVESALEDTYFGDIKNSNEARLFFAKSKLFQLCGLERDYLLDRYNIEKNVHLYFVEYGRKKKTKILFTSKTLAKEFITLYLTNLPKLSASLYDLGNLPIGHYLIEHELFNYKENHFVSVDYSKKKLINEYVFDRDEQIIVPKKKKR